METNNVILKTRSVTDTQRLGIQIMFTKSKRKKRSSVIRLQNKLEKLFREVIPKKVTWFEKENSERNCLLLCEAIHSALSIIAKIGNKSLLSFEATQAIQKKLIEVVGEKVDSALQSQLTDKGRQSLHRIKDYFEVMEAGFENLGKAREKIKEKKITLE